MEKNAILCAATVAGGRPSVVCFSAYPICDPTTKSWGFPWEPIKIACAGYHREWVSPKQNLYCLLRVSTRVRKLEMLLLRAASAKSGWAPTLRMLVAILVKIGHMLKKTNWDTNTLRAGRFLHLPFPYKEATYAENVSTSQKPLSLHYKTRLSIEIFALHDKKNNYHLRAKACLLMLCMVVHIVTTVV
jgi:hypothetical protein